MHPVQQHHVSLVSLPLSCPNCGACEACRQQLNKLPGQSSQQSWPCKSKPHQLSGGHACRQADWGCCLASCSGRDWGQPVRPSASHGGQLAQVGLSFIQQKIRLCCAPREHTCMCHRLVRADACVQPAHATSRLQHWWPLWCVPTEGQERLPSECHRPP